MAIQLQDVSQFKSHLCDENLIIADILRRHFVPFMPSVILDVGAGLGDIARMAFPEKEAILLDPLAYESGPRSPFHDRVVGDFFLFEPDSKIGIQTLLFCHSFQYLDADPVVFVEKLLKLRPANIVTVTNTNDDLLGELIASLRSQGFVFNAEEEIQEFPPSNYSEKISHAFTATVSAISFYNLAQGIAYLLDVPNDDLLRAAAETLLSEKLTTPTMTIRQTIRLYQYEF